MKKVFLFSVLTLFCSVFAPVANAAVEASKPALTATEVPEMSLPADMDMEEFLTMTPSKFEKATGKKLSWTESIKMKVAQKKLRKQIAKIEKQDAEEGQAGGSKSQIVALLLAALVGYLGIHRFYLGYTGIGIIQLLTLGGCGIWALIDLIMIITGDLKPKDGSKYDPTL